MNPRLRRVTMDHVREQTQQQVASTSLFGTDNGVVPTVPCALVAGGGPPTMYRRRSGRVIAGVASGLADHLGVKVRWVRLAFASLAALGGVGLLWVFTAQESEEAAVGAGAPAGTWLGALGVGLAVDISTLSGAVSGWVAVRSR